MLLGANLAWARTQVAAALLLPALLRDVTQDEGDDLTPRVRAPVGGLALLGGGDLCETQPVRQPNLRRADSGHAFATLLPVTRMLTVLNAMSACRPDLFRHETQLWVRPQRVRDLKRAPGPVQLREARALEG